MKSVLRKYNLPPMSIKWDDEGKIRLERIANTSLGQWRDRLDGWPCEYREKWKFQWNIQFLLLKWRQYDDEHVCLTMNSALSHSLVCLLSSWDRLHNIGISSTATIEENEYIKLHLRHINLYPFEYLLILILRRSEGTEDGEQPNGWISREREEEESLWLSDTQRSIDY